MQHGFQLANFPGNFEGWREDRATSSQQLPLYYGRKWGLDDRNRERGGHLTSVTGLLMMGQPGTKPSSVAVTGIKPVARLHGSCPRWWVRPVSRDQRTGQS